MPPRFSYFKQPSNCGPVSLRMIARFYGIAYAAEMLRKHCHIS
ncbi:cysteine peptidase family C39 domain-containing protein [Prevotella jejuni]|nr:cysteine peptidase family C39 domain-containing protein [Prevotella jejuni]